MVAKKTKIKQTIPNSSNAENNSSLKFWKTAAFILLGLVLFMSIFEIEVKLKNSNTNLSQPSSQTGTSSSGSSNPRTNTSGGQSAPVPRTSGGCGV
ncbi:MAG: hypothetical protein ACC618_00855 [Patescibacteria group bacterium]